MYLTLKDNQSNSYHAIKKCEREKFLLWGIYFLATFEIN